MNVVCRTIKQLYIADTDAVDEVYIFFQQYNNYV